MEDFEKENGELQANEQWEKPETYMLPLVNMPSLPFRLKVWVFTTKWAEDLAYVADYCRVILVAYEEIKNNPCFRKILGQILAVGNVLNGGSAKGQSDGFDVPVFGKLSSMKDNTGKSLLEYIMLTLKNQEETLDAQLKDLIQKTVFKDCDNDQLKQKVRELQSMHGTAKANFQQAKVVSATDKYVSMSIDKDLFDEKMGPIIESTEKELVLIIQEQNKVLDTHKSTCDFYDVDAKDEMRDKSETFFKTFGDFFKICEKSLPPPVKKPAPKK